MLELLILCVLDTASIETVHRFNFRVEANCKVSLFLITEDEEEIPINTSKLALTVIGPPVKMKFRFRFIWVCGDELKTRIVVVDAADDGYSRTITFRVTARLPYATLVKCYIEQKELI